MSHNLIFDTEMGDPETKWNGHIDVSFMNMYSYPMETKSIYIGEKITMDEIQRAIETYLSFRSSKKGRNRKYPDYIKPSQWRLEHDLKHGFISKSTYYRYKKLISEDPSCSEKET